MNVGKLAVMVVALAVAAIGCQTREVVVRDGGRERVEVDAAPQEIAVRGAPPAELVEQQVAPPSTEHVWIRGHWHWNGADWTWVRGHYQTRRVGYRWIPAHYAGRGGAYYYVPGHWGR